MFRKSEERFLIAFSLVLTSEAIAKKESIMTRRQGEDGRILITAFLIALTKVIYVFSCICVASEN